MGNKKRFKDSYWYRFVVITIVAAMLFGGGAAIMIASSNNPVVRWVYLAVVLTLYLAALIYSYIGYRRKNN